MKVRSINTWTINKDYNAINIIPSIGFARQKAIETSLSSNLKETKTTETITWELYFSWLFLCFSITI